MCFLDTVYSKQRSNIRLGSIAIGVDHGFVKHRLTSLRSLNEVLRGLNEVLRTLRTLSLKNLNLVKVRM